MRTNPLFGRGCSFAAVEAYLLRDALEAITDAESRARIYDERVRAELRGYFDDMRLQDRDAIRRAERCVRPNGHRVRLRERLLRRFLVDGVSVAVRGDIEVFREAMRAFHMLAPPRAWIRRPANLLKIVRFMSRGRTANANLYPKPAGPPRDAMLKALRLG